MMHPALTDRFARKHTYLRISLTDRCNLRCTYCMPEHGIDWARPEHLLTTAEIVRLGRLFIGLGINKIRLTGGEPLLHKDIGSIVRDLAATPGLQTLALTTNALKLKDLAAGLKRDGLSTVTVSLDSLKPDRFAAITRRDRLNDVMQGIEAALDAGFAPLKINIVVMANVNEDEVMDFVAWGRDRPVDLRFIEYMPFPDTKWSKAGLVPYATLRDRIGETYPLRPLSGDPSAVGKSFALEGHAATVSFVSSMTESFCADCNRLRLTADGNIKACLFHPEEKSLRDVMREGGSDEDLTAVIAAALQGKPEEHPPMEELLAMGNRTMIAIGG
jgi:cyclic pyranopterin phosphate synthase